MIRVDPTIPIAHASQPNRNAVSMKVKLHSEPVGALMVINVKEPELVPKLGGVKELQIAN